ncbi:MAG TPA: DUF2817 domain-containing protein [bacterium]|nr:DUF2817 domain-containing protein [bacterium]
MERFYPIGTPGQPWSAADKAEWLARQTRKRSYREQVLDRIDALRDRFAVTRYGALTVDPERYPLFALAPRSPRAANPWVLVTGGVHGYETSGVQGALRFAAEHAADYNDRANILIAPCVSPWAYEHIHRWNDRAIDPNRSFVADSPCEEAAALMAMVRARDVPFLMHIDLHETTDTDESEFRPAKAARDGEEPGSGEIPDGFYTVADAQKPEPDFQGAIIAAVREVTHIALPDKNGQIIGEDVTQDGVIHYEAAGLGLCMGMTDARYVTTTEVYPDSPRVTDDLCNRAQVAAVRGGLDYALSR